MSARDELDSISVRGDRIAGFETNVAERDRARLAAAVEAVLEQAEARAVTLRSTADRLNQQVMDRDQDRDIDAAVRYSHYATGAEASLAHIRTAIENALESK